MLFLVYQVIYTNRLIESSWLYYYYLPMPEILFWLYKSNEGLYLNYKLQLPKIFIRKLTKDLKN